MSIVDNKTLRKLSLTDLSPIVNIHRECFPNSRSTSLGPFFLKKMYRWYLLYEPDLAFGVAIDNNLVGFVTGSISGSSRKRFKYAFFEILFAFVLYPHLIFKPDIFEEWQGYLMSILVWPKKNNYLVSSSPQTTGVVSPLPIKAALDSIAVSSYARGEGIGKMLVNAFEVAAQQKGAGFMSLGVEYDNLAARRLYENCGWHVVHEDKAKNTASYHKMILEN